MIPLFLVNERKIRAKRTQRTLFTKKHREIPVLFISTEPMSANIRKYPILSQIAEGVSAKLR